MISNRTLALALSDHVEVRHTYLAHRVSLVPLFFSASLGVLGVLEARFDIDTVRRTLNDARHGRNARAVELMPNATI